MPAEKNASGKIKLILDIITQTHDKKPQVMDYNLDHLHSIVISESSKSYLVKDIDEINKEMVFSPLKSLCKYISNIILEMKPNYKYARSLASTILETAHDQHFFSEHLPSLTDNNSRLQHKKYVLNYLHQLTFSALQ